MTTGLIITIILAIVGWVIAIVEFRMNRKWQKKDSVANKRFEAYSQFLKKVDSMGSDMKKAPKELIGKATSEFLSDILKDNADTGVALKMYNSKIAEFLQSSIEPFSTMNQELSALKLVASDKMLVYIEKMKKLTEDLFNDFQIAFAQLSHNNVEEIKQLPTSIGNSERVKQYTTLCNEMTSLMREEIHIS